ncbi:MAG: hypothetical protein JSU95_19255 [Betaproteobacteria bacterium]|nr:MAG: hypothetical protein JSU95_19255 [Betaproteobacteria bacterium]
MSSVAEKVRVEEGTSGILQYMDEAAKPSLFRNGLVLTRRDQDGSDSGWIGVDREPYELKIHDARQLSGDQRCTLAANGFDLVLRPASVAEIDFFNHEQVVRNYYKGCEDIVREATGAHVFAFDHNVRSASGKQSKQRIAGGQQVQGPAHMVHGDYTLTSAPQRLEDLTKPSTMNDTLKGILGEGQPLIDPELAKGALSGEKRFAIINVWRNIVKEPVVTHPIALCDGQSVEPEDLVVFEIHYADRVGENYFAKYSPRHEWYYYPEITGDEALLIKQWDSAGNLARSKGAQSDASDPDAPCTFSFHSAFDDPLTPPDAPDRWSCEVRCMVVYG